MNMNIALAFQRRAKLLRDQLGVDGDLRPISAPQHVDVAVPGYVGEQYRSGGLCLISVNPAGGKDGYSPSHGDELIYTATARFAEAEEGPEAVQEFTGIARAFETAMPFWGAQWGHVRNIISAADVELDAIAYVYLVPFRTRADAGSSLPPLVIDAAIRRGFFDVLDALQPGPVIAMDRPSEGAGRRWAKSRQSGEVLYYTRKRDDHAGRARFLEELRARPRA